LIESSSGQESQIEPSLHQAALKGFTSCVHPLSHPAYHHLTVASIPSGGSVVGSSRRADVARRLLCNLQGQLFSSGAGTTSWEQGKVYWHDGQGGGEVGWLFTIEIIYSLAVPQNRLN